MTTLTQEEFDRKVRQMERECSQKAVADHIDDAVYLLQSNIRDLERIKRDLYDESLVQTLNGPQEVAEFIQSRIVTLIGTVSGNIAWKLNVRPRDVLKAVTPLSEV